MALPAICTIFSLYFLFICYCSWAKYRLIFSIITYVYAWLDLNELTLCMRIDYGQEPLLLIRCNWGNMARIINYIHYYMSNLITHPCYWYQRCLTKREVRLWMSNYNRWFTWMQLLFHALILILVYVFSDNKRGNMCTFLRLRILCHILVVDRSILNVNGL